MGGRPRAGFALPDQPGQGRRWTSEGIITGIVARWSGVCSLRGTRQPTREPPRDGKSGRALWTHSRQTCDG
eukprot:4273169-Alexandrium_andersonii.AAC.1